MYVQCFFKNVKMQSVFAYNITSNVYMNVLDA